MSWCGIQGSATAWAECLRAATGETNTKRKILVNTVWIGNRDCLFRKIAKKILYTTKIIHLNYLLINTPVCVFMVV